MPRPNASRNPASQQTSADDGRLFVWGERRREPDWDAFIAALVALALREVEDEPAGGEEDRD